MSDRLTASASERAAQGWEEARPPGELCPWCQQDKSVRRAKNEEGMCWPCYRWYTVGPGADEQRRAEQGA